MMRRNDKLRTVGLLAVCFLSAGCSKGDTAPTLPDGAIGFTTNVTRAVRTSLGEGDTFAVWARETPSDGIPSLILTQESVICTDGKWQYTNLQYWKNGATYDFYALYPHSQIATLESADDREGIPYLVIAEFDATQSVDLMTAENTGISYTPPARPVAFTFRHLLSQVQIVGRLDPALVASETEVRIISAKLYGMSAKGSCIVRPGGDGIWTEIEATTAVAPFAKRNEELMLTDSGEPVFGDGGMLLVPQTVGDDFILEVKYRYEDEKYSDEEPFTLTVSLADAGLAKWTAGKSYRYTFTVGGEYILLERPTVSGWNEAAGGNIPIDVNNPQS